MSKMSITLIEIQTEKGVNNTNLTSRSELTKVYGSKDHEKVFESVSYINKYNVITPSSDTSTSETLNSPFIVNEEVKCNSVNIFNLTGELGQYECDIASLPEVVKRDFIHPEYEALVPYRANNLEELVDIILHFTAFNRPSSGYGVRVESGEAVHLSSGGRFSSRILEGRLFTDFDYVVLPMSLSVKSSIDYYMSFLRNRE